MNSWCPNWSMEDKKVIRIEKIIDEFYEEWAFEEHTSIINVKISFYENIHDRFIYALSSLIQVPNR